jgi:tetraacyldisaccharide 4'-kinase
VIASVVRRVWGEDGLPARIARGALLPFEAAYRAVVSVRGTMYDRGLLSSRSLALPAVSVGNLTVGGTGKTPMAAWLVSQLLARGARPAVVLRDYGGDEALVHRLLNRGAPVVSGADRVDAVRRAQAKGADLVVLDDAFQHRRARREADIVLLSADEWAGSSRRLLPAGPWREPLSGIRRASLIVVTRKAVPMEIADTVVEAARRVVPDVPSVVARLAPSGLVDAHAATTLPLLALDGTDILAVAGIANPEAFRRQLVALGARVRLRAFADHHPYTAADAIAVAQDGEQVRYVVCTLKDAVKLAPLWPRGGAGLWYLTQEVILERGRPAMDQLIGDLLEARVRYTTTVGQEPARH